MKNIILGVTWSLTAFLYAEEVELTEEVIVVEETAEDPEWEKLRSAASAYVKAFNEKNAEAIANLYAEDGEILLTEETKVVGRDSISQHYARVFDSEPNIQVGLEATNVKYVTPSLVLEEGTVYSSADGELVSTHNYAVINAKQEDGTWRIKQSRAREVEETEANDQLGEIDGIIGDWVGFIGEGQYKVNYRWDPSGAWIIGRGRYIAPNIEVVTVTTRIGWDESIKQIVSWSFDSEGGHNRAVWEKGEDNWTMKTQGVSAAGEATSSTRTVEVLSPESVNWWFEERKVGEESEPDFEIRLVKSPPKPFVKPQSE